MLKRLLDNKIIRNAVLAVLIIMAAVSLTQGIRNAIRDSQDFQWDAAKTLSMRINPYDESMNPTGILDQYGYDEYYLQMEANQFPSLLMLLLPFTLFKPLTARYVWIACNLVFTGLILFLLRKTFLKDEDTYVFWCYSLLMIAGTPYRNQLGVGQHTLFAFCFFLIAVYFSEYTEKRNSLITIIALFVCYFKYTLTLPLVLFFVYKKRYREIIISALGHVVLTAVSAVWLNDSFINMIIKPLKVSSALSAEGGLDISALFGGSLAAVFAGALIMILMLAIACIIPENHDGLLISVLVFISVIITYHRTYDFFVILTGLSLFEELKNSNNTRFSEGFIDALFIYYTAVTFSVYFVLRLFSENLISKIAVGTLYYILTIICTYIALRVCLDGGKNGKQEKAD